MIEPILFDNLLNTWSDLPFECFRDGIEAYHIKRGSPAMAILRYAPGAMVPHHLHTGLETILVLEGVQSDERGNYGQGTLILNPKGSSHSVWSAQGCVVLIQWEKPIEILD
jgi:anti-sigma factor ChrR (cupin superfamily)